MAAAQARHRAVFAACRAQGIDNDARKAIQLEVTGKASLTEMGPADLAKLLDRLNRRVKPGAGARSEPGEVNAKAATAAEWRFVFKLATDRQGMAKKIFRLAEALGALQTPPVPVMSKAYIEGISKRMTGTTHPLEFCDAEQLHKIVQALEIHVKRRKDG